MYLEDQSNNGAHPWSAKPGKQKPKAKPHFLGWVQYKWKNLLFTHCVGIEFGSSWEWKKNCISWFLLTTHVNLGSVRCIWKRRFVVLFCTVIRFNVQKKIHKLKLALRAV
jgi:hypothetical protein